METPEINSYLQFIGAQMRIGELRTYLFGKDTESEDYQTTLEETHALEENCNTYLNALLHGRKSSNPYDIQGVSNGNF